VASEINDYIASIIMLARYSDGHLKNVYFIIYLNNIPEIRQSKDLLEKKRFTLTDYVLKTISEAFYQNGIKIFSEMFYHNGIKIISDIF
jgi:hypothetical protein